MKHCHHCRGENRDGARFCGHCGRPFTADTPGQSEPAKGNVRQAPNPRIATLLSCLWPGLGQLYNGQIVKGAAFILVQVLLWTWIPAITFVNEATKTPEEEFAENVEEMTKVGDMMECIMEGKQDACERVAQQSPRTGHIVFDWAVFLVPPISFWIYGMTDAKREAERLSAGQ